MSSGRSAGRVLKLNATSSTFAPKQVKDKEKDVGKFTARAQIFRKWMNEYMTDSPPTSIWHR